MKRFALALALLTFAFSVSAAPYSGKGERGLGRCTYISDNVDPVSPVPEASSTLALASIGFAALGFASMAVKRAE